jgi:hypothetical protein
MAISALILGVLMARQLSIVGLLLTALLCALMAMGVGALAGLGVPKNAVVTAVSLNCLFFGYVVGLSARYFWHRDDL